MRKLYLIDGVGVPEKIFFRRQLWGERPDAIFEFIEIERKDYAGRSRGRDH